MVDTTPIKEMLWKIRVELNEAKKIHDKDKRRIVKRKLFKYRRTYEAELKNHETNNKLKLACTVNK